MIAMRRKRPPRWEQHNTSNPKLRRINAELALKLEAERVRREKRRQRMQRELELRPE